MKSILALLVVALVAVSAQPKVQLDLYYESL
jgi:hypothetical protein